MATLYSYNKVYVTFSESITTISNLLYYFKEYIKYYIHSAVLSSKPLDLK